MQSVFCGLTVPLLLNWIKIRKKAVACDISHFWKTVIVCPFFKMVNFINNFTCWEDKARKQNWTRYWQRQASSPPKSVNRQPLGYLKTYWIKCWQTWMELKTGIFFIHYQKNITWLHNNQVGPDSCSHGPYANLFIYEAKHFQSFPPSIHVSWAHYNFILTFVGLYFLISDLRRP